MGVFRRMLKRALMAMVPSHRFLVQGPQRSRQLALTFDDGPHPRYTSRLLDGLAEYGIPATFFLIGENAEAHPDLVTRMVAEGHSVANHSWTHGDPAKTSPEDLVEEARRTRNLLEDLTGQSCPLFRPPKGAVTMAKLNSLWRADFNVALWSANPQDEKMTSAKDLWNWCSEWQPRAGDIVVFHDGMPWSSTALPLLAPLKLVGWKFVRISDWLPSPKPLREPVHG